MSETERNDGVLTLVAIVEVDLETTAKLLLAGTEMPSWCDTWEEVLEESEAYHVYKDRVYSVDNKMVEDWEDIFEATENEDGTIRYTTKYYNGGCSFGEALDIALDKMESARIPTSGVV